MEALYSWVKNVIYFMIFLSAACNLLADAKYEQYIRFFAGALLILLTFGPLLGGTGLDQQIQRLFAYFSVKTEAEELKEKMWAVDGKRREAVLSQYRQAAEREIGEMAEEAGLDVAKVELAFGEEGEDWGTVCRVRLYLLKPQDAGALGEIRVEPVEIAVNGDTASGKSGLSPAGRRETGQEDSQQISSFKGKVARYYGLEESDIEIMEQDD